MRRVIAGGSDGDKQGLISGAPQPLDADQGTVSMWSVWHAGDDVSQMEEVDDMDGRTNVWPKTRLDGAGGGLGLSFLVKTNLCG